MRILITTCTWSSLARATQLETEGLLVSRIDDPADLTHYLKFGQQNALVFEQDLPGLSVRAAVGLARKHAPDLPIVVLTGADADFGQAQALYDLGADLVVGAGIGTVELAMRLRSMVMRANRFCPPSIDLDGIKVNPIRQRVVVGGLAVRLTRLEYEVVETLALARGGLVDRAGLMDHLYAWQNEPEARTLDVHLVKIRRKLAEASQGKANIETYRGRGFRLACDTVADPHMAEAA